MEWTKEQQQVIDLRNRNILVSAAAGSGKTAVLVERIITRLTEDAEPINVDELLIVTFTEAAASEMKERILLAIEKKLKEKPDNVHLQRQASLIHSAMITTIHSFCLSVIREHFHTIDLDPGFRIGEEGELKLLKKDVLDELLEEEYRKNEPAFLAFVERYATGRDDRKLEELILQIYEFSRSYPNPSKWLRSCENAYEVESVEDLLESPAGKLVTENIKRYAEDAVSLLEEGVRICEEPDGPYMYKETLESEMEGWKYFLASKNLLHMFERRGKAEGGKLKANRDKGVSKELAEQVKDIRKQTKAFLADITKNYLFQSPEEMIEDIQAAKSTVKELVFLVEEFAESFEGAKRKRNLIDFGDMEQLALRILTEEKEEELCPSLVAEEYQKRFREIMIDEYQDSNLIQEKGFIPSTKSFAIAEDELGKMVYYNHAQELLYVLADQVLYRIDLDKNQQEVLAKGLEAGKYAVSDDGHQLAYQTDGEKDAAKEIRVMDLSSGDEYSVKAAKNEAVRPLGFLNGDFIYGILRTSDAGKTASGEKTTPMYQLEIHDSKNKKIAEYSFEDQGIYISDILIEGNMVTLNRLAKAGEIYNVTSQEYITNNVEKKDTKISLTSYSSEKLGKQYRFTFAEGIEKTEVKLLQPDQQVAENALTIVLKGKDDRVKYYVYGMGELVGIYDKAGYAIQKAEKISGVVISSEQAYVWEKGNRDLVYSIENVVVTKESGESSLEACERYMKSYEAEKTDLTGCTLDQVLYVINKGCPVIALTSADHAILMTGYSKTDITYSDPDTGASQIVTMDEMNAMVAGSGNTFIGYIK